MSYVKIKIITGWTITDVRCHPPLPSKSHDKEIMRLYLAIIPDTLSEVLLRRRLQISDQVTSPGELRRDFLSLELKIGARLKIYTVAIQDDTTWTTYQPTQEFNSELESTTQAEVNKVMIQDNTLWIMHVDGSSNIRGSGLGVAFKSSQGAI
ncbi:hypothetical protein OSB04_024212 [Centaurea solstitialis]|uniref:Uncharacterized protein n=1 Tax=Centaurea solstitialis TaxID=347529 RepID=A0AA38WA50_9ASTR|nr:hypothetical protein OSB04_024212 [Centaurea solstitialis]